MYNIALINKNEIKLSGAITDELYKDFIAYLDTSPKTVETYTRALRQFFNFLALNGINRPTRADILAFKEELTANHKPTTVQNYIIAVRQFFKWTEQEGFYKNIADNVKGAKLDREHKKDYLTSNQVKELLKSIDKSTIQGLRDYAILTLMITGGLRTIEIERANIGDIRTAGDNVVIYIQGKGRVEKTDYIKLQPTVEKALREYIKATKKTDPEQAIFTSTSNNSHNKRLTTRSISGIVKARLIEAGYNSDKLTAHSLRHTAVTLSLIAGKDITEVQQFARHQNIATTMIYNHALDKAKNSCSEAIANAIF